MDIDSYLLANVSPAQSGLPFVIHISEEQGPEAWAKVARADGGSAFVAVGPSVRMLEGDLPPEDFALIRRWIDANRDVILGYWDRRIDGTGEALAALKPFPKP